MKKTTRAEKAKETLHILETGCYLVNNQMVDISESLRQNIDHSVLHRANEFGPIMAAAVQKIRDLNAHTTLTVENDTVLACAARMAGADGVVGCLNFASAKNPGGGFLNGALAQEESLALSSSLYATQMKHYELYSHNQSRKTYLYTDHMIYSPGTLMFRDDDGELLTQPYQLSIVTSPAVNVGAIRTNKPEEMELVEQTMLQRMDKLLSLFVYYNIRRLLLGAWGCGVFQNDASQIAQWFAHYLKEGGKYHRCFDEVCFAVYDRSKTQENITAFEEVFGGVRRT